MHKGWCTHFPRGLQVVGFSAQLRRRARMPTHRVMPYSEALNFTCRVAQSTCIALLHENFKYSKTLNGILWRKLNLTAKNTSKVIEVQIFAHLYCSFV